jgi:hypothetical protein
MPAKKLDLFTRRYFQITMAFMVFVFVQNFFNIPHSIWIIITGAMVYSGFHAGTVVKRAYLRLNGTIIGIAAVGIIWHFLHLDYRLAIPYFVFIVWGCVFFQLLPYNRFIIIVTLLSDILVELPNTANFNLQYYMQDRLVCTIIAFGMCVAIEYLWFGRSNMMYLHYLDAQSTAHKMLQELYDMSKNNTLNYSQILKKINAANAQIAKISTIMEDAKYESKRGYHQFKLSPADKQFNIETIQTFRKIVSLHYLRHHEPMNPKLPLLIHQVETLLEHAKQ